jgi:hypothetical protein
MKQIPNSFTSYEFSDREILEGSVLSALQIAVLQNELANIATNKLNLDYDPRNPLKFAQDEAFLKGQMSIINVMLLRSSDSEITLQKLAGNP